MTIPVILRKLMTILFMEYLDCIDAELTKFTIDWPVTFSPNILCV